MDKKDKNQALVNEQELKRNLEISSLGEQIAGLGYFERNWQTGKGYWSEGFYKLLGIKPEDMDCTHTDFMKFVHKDDLKRVAEHIKTSLQEQSAMDIEFRIVQADGNVIDIHGIGKSFFESKGKPINTIGTFQDITETKKLLSKNQESIDELSFLNRIIISAQKQESLDEICKVIAKEVSSFYPNNIVAVSLYDNNLGGVRIRAIEGVGKKYQQFAKTLGKDPKKMVFDAKELDKTYEHYTSGSLIKVEGGLSELMKGQLPGFVCRNAEKLMSVTSVHTAGFKDSDMAKGGIVVLMRNNKPLLNSKPIEVALGYVSELLKRLLADEELHAANQQLQASEQQLKEYNQQLIATNQQLTASEKELMAAKEKAEINEKYYHTILNNMGDGVLVKDDQSRLLLVNDAFCDMLNLDRSVMIGKTLAEEVTPEERESFLRIDKEVIQTGIENINEETITVRGKQTRTISTRKTCFVNDRGEKLLIGVVRDITDRKMAEIELLEKEVQYYNLANSGTALIWASGLDKLCFYFNDPWLNFTGRTLEQEYGNGWTESVHPDDFDHCLNIYVTSFDKKVPFEMEYRMKRADGEYRWILDLGTPNYNSVGEFVGYIGHCFDITDRKEVQKDLIEAKEKAEESDRLKSAFLANMSHEIRTPMNGILGFTGLLIDPNLSDETKEQYIEIIQKSGDRMLNTVNDIIEISKIEAGLTEVKYAEIDVSALLKNLLDFFQLQAQQKGLILSSESEEAGLIVNTDLNKFESILTNLIKNAIKFTDNGKIDVSFGVKGGLVQFCVKDTGIGVPQNRINAIFNRFEQADIEDTRVFQGSGLGLAITKSYVEMLGGNIWVESIEGVGSTFCFTVPNLSETMKPDLNIQEEKTENKEKPLSKLKILIVEDDEVSADFLEIILKDFAKKVIQANSGEQAIELCKINPDIDVILMDIKMPGINGFEATRKIREFNNEVIIIAQTAYSLSGDKEKVIAAGCDAYITKPVRQTELIEIITKQLSLKK